MALGVKFMDSEAKIMYYIRENNQQDTLFLIDLFLKCFEQIVLAAKHP
jgi:hypothetical protein